MPKWYLVNWAYFMIKLHYLPEFKPINIGIELCYRLEGSTSPENSNVIAREFCKRIINLPKDCTFRFYFGSVYVVMLIDKPTRQDYIKINFHPYNKVEIISNKGKCNGLPSSCEIFDELESLGFEILR